VIRALEVTEWRPIGPIGFLQGASPRRGRCAAFAVRSARDVPVLPGCGIAMGVSAMRASMPREWPSLMQKTKLRAEVFAAPFAESSSAVGE